MGILSWIIFGLIAGILAKWIMPGKDGGGFFMTILLGIVGAEYDNNRHTHHNNRCFFHLYAPGAA